MAAAIETQGLCKRYLVGQAQYGSLRESFAGGARRLIGRRKSAPGLRELWALRDLDLEVEEGSALGVLGRNGAGKTTLLRILSGITEPTGGVARVLGRVGALLEVGTGFHLELTGRENVYLNSALLGLSRRETAARFDQIVEFAGIEPFLNTPLKRYSAGMTLRLAFAVAAHVDPDIVLIDEVLAVGDAEFQRRCLGRVADLEREGRTAVVVSHDLGIIARLCSRAIWLDGGMVRHAGPAAETIERYRRAQLGRTGARVTRRDSDLELSVAVLDAAGDPIESPRRGEPLQIEFEYELRRPTPTVDLAVYIVNEFGLRVLDEQCSDSGEHLPTRGRQIVSVWVPPVLRAGDYALGVWIASGYERESLFDAEVLSFTVLPCPDDRQEALDRPRLIQPQVRWRTSSSEATASQR